MQPSEFPAYGMPWDAMTQLIARATGKEKLAGELIAKAKDNLDAVRQRHPDWAGKTAVAAYHFGGETGIFASSDTRGNFLIELGLDPAPEMKKLDATSAFYQKLSPEDLSALDADLLFWV